jgi:Prokaryotic Cytochrome C oxidase subunit IV
MRTSTRRLTVLWVVLLALTLLSAEVLRNAQLEIGGTLLMAAVVLVTLTKARIIGLHYMELKGAPWPLRAAFEAWLVVVSVAILFLHTR